MVFKSRFLLGLIASTQIICSFISMGCIIRKFGVGVETDLYFLSQVIPFTLNIMISTPLINLWIGIFSKLNCANEEQKYLTIFNSQVFLICAALLSMILIIDPLIELMYPKYSDAHTLSLVQYLKIFYFASIIELAVIPNIIFARANERFILVEILYAISSLLFLFGIILIYKNLTLIEVVYLGFFKSLSFAILCYVFIGIPGLSITSAFEKLSIFKKLSPLFVLSLVTKNNKLVDSTILALAPAGSLSAFNISTTFNSSFGKIIQKSFYGTEIPHFNRKIKDEKYLKIRADLRQSLKNTIIANVLFVLMLLLMRPYFESVLVKILDIELVAANTIWALLLFLTPSLITATFGTLQVAIYYGLENTVYPTVIGIISFFIGVVIKILGFYKFGLEGLAMAHSIYYLFSTAIQFVSLEFLLRNLINEK